MIMLSMKKLTLTWTIMNIISHRVHIIANHGMHDGLSDYCIDVIRCCSLYYSNNMCELNFHVYNKA